MQKKPPSGKRGSLPQAKPTASKKLSREARRLQYRKLLPLTQAYKDFVEFRGHEPEPERAFLETQKGQEVYATLMQRIGLPVAPRRPARVIPDKAKSGPPDLGITTLKKRRLKEGRYLHVEVDLTCPIEAITDALQVILAEYHPIVPHFSDTLRGRVAESLERQIEEFLTLEKHHGDMSGALSDLYPEAKSEKSYVGRGKQLRDQMRRSRKKISALIADL